MTNILAIDDASKGMNKLPAKSSLPSYAAFSEALEAAVECTLVWRCMQKALWEAEDEKLPLDRRAFNAQTVTMSIWNEDKRRKARDFFAALDQNGELYKNQARWRAAVANMISAMLGPLPPPKVSDVQAYVVLMVEKVAEEANIASLETAIRKIHASRKLAPTIAEMLEIIEEENRKWSNRRNAIREECEDDYSFEFMQAEARELLEQLEKQIAEKAEADEARRHEKEARRKAAAAAEKAHRAAFPVGGGVSHSANGHGVVEAHMGICVEVCFKGQSRRVYGHDLLPLLPIQKAKVGDRVSHEQFGRGTVGKVDDIFLDYGITFDDGRKFWLIEHADQLARLGEPPASGG